MNDIMICPLLLPRVTLTEGTKEERMCRGKVESHTIIVKIAPIMTGHDIPP